ncbi:MAG: hypothetical protein Q7R77_02450 [Candidatus Daviesbacteria bacterium]|nr:hypothetical protein [Candidatus Daviesbacteria bacterium]
MQQVNQSRRNGQYIIQRRKYEEKIYNLQFTIYNFRSYCYILHFTFYISTAIAVDSTPSADIAAKLKAFQKGAASKAAQLKELISKKLQNKAYVGSIQSQSGNSLTLSARSGPKIASINEDTVFASNVKSKKYSRKNISNGDYIGALGDVDETGVLTAKKIILLNPTPYTLNPKTYLWGRILAISDKLITLRDNDLNNTAAIFPASSKVKINNSVILTGYLNKDNIFEAEFVYKIATRSATN